MWTCVNGMLSVCLMRLILPIITMLSCCVCRVTFNHNLFNVKRANTVQNAEILWYMYTTYSDQFKSVVKKHFKPLSALKRKLSKRPARICPYDARARNVCAVEEGLHSKTNKHTHTQARTSTQLTCPARLVSSRLSVVSRRHCCGHTRTRTYEKKMPAEVKEIV